MIFSGLTPLRNSGRIAGTLDPAFTEIGMSKKILVVDDTVDTRGLVHLYLKSAGQIVFVAADGGEGLYQAKVNEPDLIVTDITMPTLNGYEMIRQLRATERFADTPIIALTAYGDEQLQKAREAGADRASTPKSRAASTRLSGRGLRNLSSAVGMTGIGPYA